MTSFYSLQGKIESGKNVSSKNDLVCMLEADNRAWLSRAVKKDSNPKFNEDFFIAVNDLKSVVYVRLYARGDGRGDVDTEIGSAKLTASEVTTSPKQLTLKLEGSKKATLTISIARTEFHLKDFKLTTTLGTGTFGRVRVAKHKPTGKNYVMKILKKAAMIELKQVDKVRLEKDIALMLNHPFLVSSYGSFQDETCLYILMEFVQGGELFSYLRNIGRVDDATGKFFAAQVVLALDYMHSKRLCYRDLKPENILIDSEGYLKITDFGFAKEVRDRTYSFCGTPDYLAPEIIQNAGHNKGVDWWAVGVLIYEMLAGFPPFYDDNPLGIFKKILSGRLRFPSHFDKNVRDLISRLLTIDITRRFGCMRMGAEDIKNHRWFRSIDWAQLEARATKPPYEIPQVSDPNDTSNFDDYPDSDDEAPKLTKDEQKMFQNF